MTTVLVTNDDGVHAAGLRANADAMRARGFDVIVVAPDGNRSATGHHVSVREALELTLVSEEPGEVVWSCSGSPADCVRVAMLADWIPPIDVVVSGFNHGVNLGEDVYYSGTVAAAIEASLMGLPAIAASQAAVPGDTGFLSEKPSRFPFGAHLAEAAGAVAGLGRGSGLVLNLNYPARLVDTRVRESTLGSRRWAESGITATTTTSGYLVQKPWAVDPPAEREAGSDFAHLAHGAVTATVLQARRGIAGGQWHRLVDLGLPLEVSDPDEGSR